MHAEEQHLLRIAEAVTDRSPVDWKLESEAHPSLRGKIENLQIVNSISAIQSSPEEPAAPDQLPSSQLETMEMPVDQDSSASSLERWGQLEIRGSIARGGIGEVYRAYDPSLQREVALKLPRVADSRHSRTFLSEARRLARIRHQNVLQVFGAEEHEGRVGIWTDLLEGRTLEECLEDQGSFGAREAALVGIDLCRALAAVHGAGMVHRDVKTANVIREEGGRIVLLDFSAVTERTGAGRAKGTATTRGTPIYMAPEQLDGEDPSPVGDIYSLGVLLYRLVTNRYPVEAGNLEGLRRQHETPRPNALRDLRPDLPSNFVSAIDRALAADPRERFQTAGEMERALSASLGTSSGEISVAPPVSRWSRKAWAGIAATVAIAAFAWMVVRGLGAGAVDLEASLYRKGVAAEERLQEGSNLEVGDRLFLEVKGAREMYVYVLNEDSVGRRYALFPLPGLDLTNPLAPDVVHRLPGIQTTTVVGENLQEEKFWQVSSVGGRETLAVIASKRRLTDLEAQIAGLAQAGSPEAVELDERQVTNTLRGIGGVYAEPVEADRGDRTTLADLAREIAGPGRDEGLETWMIQLINPGR